MIISSVVIVVARGPLTLIGDAMSTLTAVRYSNIESTLMILDTLKFVSLHFDHGRFSVIHGAEVDKANFLTGFVTSDPRIHIT